MLVKAGLLLIALLVGGNAFPAEERDMSIFFDHTDSSQRIVGGSNAGTVPYMVAMTTGVTVNNLICGASLVSTRHVLTAAHCIGFVISGDGLLNSLRATVGTNRWNWFGTKYPISHHVIHPNYSPSTIKNDIGFLITVSNVVLTSSVQLVALNYDWIAAGTATTVTGWGRTRTGGSLSSTLQRLNAPVVDGATCVTEVAQRAAVLNILVPHVDPALEICTFLANGRGTCNGDSGGALLRVDMNQQIGIVSWGLPCARNAPDMFVRVSAYRNWILQNLSTTTQ